MAFLVFEGLDGSGKSSLMISLEKFLQENSVDFVRTREPGGTPLGDEIRELILRTHGHAPTPRTELLLYEASRAQHVDQVIRPALAENKWVLCDRFTASSIAFQAGGREIDEGWVEKLNSFATGGVTPELTVLLDLSVEESRRRQQRRQNFSGVDRDRIESEADSFHEKVRQSFLQQAGARPNDWLVLDAGQSPELLQRQLLDFLRGRGWLEF